MKKSVQLLLIGVFIFGLSDLKSQEFEESFDFNETLLNVRGILVESNEQQSAAMGRSQKKLDEGLQLFLKTPFMDKYREIKLEAESLAGTFKALAQSYDPKEVGRVRIAYNKIAEQFNLQLLEIKNDFMDKKKLKLIRQHPDMYSNSLQFKLRELRDDYAQNFEKVVAEITGNDTYAAVPLGAILGLIKLSIDFTNFIASANFASRQIKEEHLNRYFIEPYRFRPWDEIPTGEGDYYSTGGDDSESYYEEPYDESNDPEIQNQESQLQEDLPTSPPDSTVYGTSRIKKVNPFLDDKKKPKKKKKNN